MKKPLFFLITVIFFKGNASMDSAFKDGANHASRVTQGIESNIKSGRGQSEVPQFQGEISIKEEEIKKARDHLESNKYGKDLEEIHATRDIFIVDDTDPVIVRSENINKDPKKALQETEEVIAGKDGETIEYCEECPDEEYLVTGRREKKRYVYLNKPPYITAGQTCKNHGHLTIRVDLVNESDGLFREDGDFRDIRHVRTVSWGGAYVDETYRVNGTEVTLRKTIMQDGHPWIKPGCYLVPALQNHVLSAATMIQKLLGGDRDEYMHWGEIGSAYLHHRIVDDKRQHYYEMDSNVRHCEELLEQGLCRYHSIQRDSPSVKYWKGLKVRDSWGETVTYACRASCKDTCKMLKARGCSREPNPTCMQRAGSKCIRWRWRFRCKDRLGMKKHKFSKQSPYCLGGDCIDSSYESDKDMVSALSYLSILEAARKDMKNGMNIFQGKPMSCTRHSLNFTDCCSCGSNGWGVNLGLSNCSSEEKTLARLRGEKKCVSVGTYCTAREPLTRTCIRKKTVFCCFGSKFAKLLQEQGKRQLGQNFGRPESPNCRGLTAEELSRIDFSRLDLSDVVEDVANSFKTPPKEHFAKGMELKHIQDQVQKKIKSGAERESVYLKENLKHMTSSARGGNK